jgi:hypothetical protein
MAALPSQIHTLTPSLQMTQTASTPMESPTRPFFDLYYVPPIQLRAKGEAHAAVTLDLSTIPPPVHANGPGATPAPGRLLNFALPSEVRLDADALERPCSSVDFCLTDHRGHRAYGSGLTVVEAADDGSVALWAVIALSSSAIVEVFRSLLLSLYAQRAAFGLGGPGCTPSPSLGTFCERARAELQASAAILEHVQAHHLWVGVQLTPLCKALKWSVPELAYLLLCLLTDQRVLLHSAHRQLPFPCATGLQALAAPFRVQGIFIPYATCCPPSHARSCLRPCAQPCALRPHARASSLPCAVRARAESPPVGGLLAASTPWLGAVGSAAIPRAHCCPLPYPLPLSLPLPCH